MNVVVADFFLYQVVKVVCCEEAVRAVDDLGACILSGFYECRISGDAVLEDNHGVDAVLS